jgi:choline-sulfatase
VRVLYFDIDSLRPDHLGCYGYHRDTSPNIDEVARRGVRFDNVYVTDAPCLPSRTALWSGRCGFHTGVVGHGGTAAQPFVEGPGRGFKDLFGSTVWMRALRDRGMKTVTISTFADRHAAWHWYANFSEVYNCGMEGIERADEVYPIALDWIRRNAGSDNWFLHVNLWDPHTPYRTPMEFGNPFEQDPLPAWLTEEVRQRGWNGFGPRSTQEPNGWDYVVPEQYPRMPAELDSMETVKQWVDAYDVGVRYADEYIGRLLNALSDLGVLDDTAIVIGADHGENLGELNVWGDHHTADAITSRVPLIMRLPGNTAGGRTDAALHYHYDWAATLIELVEGTVPGNWDGRPFTAALREGREEGRPYLVCGQAAWSCQRSIRFDNYICLRTYHDGYRELEPVMLFDLQEDPHEQHDLTLERPEVVQRAMTLLADWQHEMVLSAPTAVDPMVTVLREGGPFHTRGMLPTYLQRLRETGRGHHADRLAARHPGEL